MCSSAAAQDVIGASKMDEKFLEEIRRQERALSDTADESDATPEEPARTNRWQSRPWRHRAAKPPCLEVMHDDTTPHSRRDKSKQCTLIVGEMYDRIVKGEPPTMTLPVRTKNNIGFDSRSSAFTSMERKQSIRDATSLGSAKQLLRALARR